VGHSGSLKNKRVSFLFGVAFNSVKLDLFWILKYLEVPRLVITGFTFPTCQFASACAMVADPESSTFEIIKIKQRLDILDPIISETLL